MTELSNARPLALVTGASAGIGYALAEELLDRGHDLIVVAEDDRIAAVPTALAADGASVTPVQADLRTQEGVEQVWRVAQGAGRALDVACLNAGVGAGKAFVDQDLSKVFEVIDLNCRGTAHLLHVVLRDMVGRDSGRVLMTSSIGSEMPGAFQAVYNASKSFVQSLTEALQEELRSTSVTITSLMPGPTETEFFERADLEDTLVGQSKQDDPDKVAKAGVEALLKGERKVVAASLKTKAMSAGSKVTPDSVKALMHRGMAEPGTGKDS